MRVVPDPLFISARLMAALKIEGAGVIHLEATGFSPDGRVTFRHVIEDAKGNVLDDSMDSIRSGIGDEPDYLGAMQSILGFLSHEAGRYWRTDLKDPAWLFNADVAEWAHQNDDEIAIALAELEIYG